MIAQSGRAGLPPNEEPDQVEPRAAALAAVISIATKWLLGPEGAATRAFLSRNGLDEAAIRALRLGLVHDHRALRRALAPEHHAPALDGGILSERFSGYVIYPAHDERGAPLTMYGRWPAAPQAGRPHMLALPGPPPRSPVYLDLAIAEKRRDLVLVQDVFDAAVLRARGDPRVIASGGPRVTPSQIATLARSGVRSLIVCLDRGPRDESTLACLRDLADAGIPARSAIELPEGKRPAALVLQEGIKAWSAIIGSFRNDQARRSLRSKGAPRGEGRYEERPEGLFFRPEDDRTDAVQLSNFVARIVAELVLDDGSVQRRVLELEVRQGQEQGRCRVAASEFDRLRWVTAELGPGARLSSGRWVPGRVRQAIRSISGDVPRRVVHTHLGWREVNGRWHYLHALSAQEGIEMELAPPLAHYSLPASPAHSDARAAVAASLRFLDLAPLCVTAPIHGAVWSAALGEGGSTLHVLGSGGAELATLAGQHWGPLVTALPSHRDLVDRIALLAKDAVVVVVGCGSGLPFCRGSPPRATLLLCGKGVQNPMGMELVVRRSDLALDALEECRAAAAAGVLAQCMAGFLDWLRPCLVNRRQDLQSKKEELRNAFARPGGRAWAAESAAHFYLGMSMFAEYATLVGGLTESDSVALLEGTQAALQQALAIEYGTRSASGDPLARFFAVLSAALGMGRAHLEDPQLGAPAESQIAWGWRRTSHWGDPPRWEARGPRIGWVSGKDLYLDLGVALSVVLEIDPALILTRRELGRMLVGAGLVQSRWGSRKTIARRLRFAGERRSLVHFSTRVLESGPKSGRVHAAGTQDH